MRRIRKEELKFRHEVNMQFPNIFILCVTATASKKRFPVNLVNQRSGKRFYFMSSSHV